MTTQSEALVYLEYLHVTIPTLKKSNVIMAHLININEVSNNLMRKGLLTDYIACMIKMVRKAAEIGLVRANIRQ